MAIAISLTLQDIILGDSQENVAATLVSDSNKCWVTLEPHFSFPGKQWKKRTTHIKNHFTENAKVCDGNPYATDGFVQRKEDSQESGQTEQLTGREVGCCTC